MKKISNPPENLGAYSRIIFFVSFLIVTLGFVTISMAQVVETSEGPNYASEAESEAEGDEKQEEWEDPENALADDGESASAGVLDTGGDKTHFLNLWNYGFDIPATASITGVKMEVNRQASRTGGGSNLDIRDEYIQLILDGERVGDNLANTVDALPVNEFGIAEYGGQDELWGLILSPEDITSSGFGASVRYRKETNPVSGYVDVDWVRLTVYYEVDEGPAYVTLGGPQNVTAGEISDEMTLTVFNYEGVETEVEFDTDFDLTSTSGDFSFYSDQSGSDQITSVTVKEAASTATFYYRDEEAGDQTVTATWNEGNTGTNLGFAEHDITVLHAEASVVEVYIQPDPTQTAGVPLTGIPAARVLDEFNNPVGGGVEVTAAAQTGAGELTASSDNNVITDNDGVATFSNLIIEIADDYHLLFSIDENDANVTTSDEAQSDLFTVEAAAAHQFAFVDYPVDNELVAGEPGSFTVEIQDEFENPTTDHTGYIDIISVDPVAGTFLPVSVDIANGETSATFTWEHTEAGFYTFKADADGVDSIEITVEVVAADAHQLAFADQPQDAVSGEILDPVTIRIEDEFANLISDATDMITVALTDAGDADLGGTLQVAAVDGIATFSDLNVDIADSYTLTAISDDLSDAVSDEFTISAGDADAQLSEITADPTMITTEESSEITVAVRDGSGNAVGAGIALFVSTNLGELDGDGATFSGTTNVDGLVQVDLTSAATGTATVTAWLGSDDTGDEVGSVEVTVTPGEADAQLSEITADPTAITTEESSVITVAVKDGSGNAVGAGIAVFVSTNLGELDGDGATFTGATDVDGLVEVDLTSTATGTATVIAWLGSDETGDEVGSVEVTVTPGGADATLSNISADPTAITTEETSEITVTVMDGSGNAVGSGIAVYVSTNLGELAGDGATFSGATDTNGLVQVDLTSTATGTATVTAWLGSDETGDEVGSVEVTVTPGNADAQLSEITADPTTITTEESSEITVAVRDGSGNAVGAGIAVFVSTNLGELDGDGATFTSATDTNGLVQVDLTSTATGTATVTAWLGSDETGDEVGSVEVAVTPGNADAQLSEITADPTTITTEESSEITVAVKDGSGNAVGEGIAVFVSTNLGELDGDGLTFSGTTNADGLVEVDLTSTATGTATVTAWLGSNETGDEVGSVEVTVTPGDADAQLSEITADPTAITTEQSSEITVTVKDGSGNAVGSGIDVFLATNLGELDDDVATFTSATDGDGLVQVDLTSTATGTATVTAWLGSDDTGDQIGLVNVSIEAAGPITPDPILQVEPRKLKDFEYIYGEGPAFDSFEVVGALLRSNREIKVAVTEGLSYFEVSHQGDFSSSLEVSYPSSSLEEIINVRMVEGLDIGVYNGKITVSGGGATKKTLNLEGEVIEPDPFFTVIPEELTAFEYEEADGGPFIDSLNVTGEYLEEDGEVILEVTTGADYFALSVDENSYTNTVTLGYAERTLNQDIAVQMIAGLEAGEYQGEITVSGGGAPRDKVVSLFGEVLPPEFEEAESISEVIGGSPGNYFRISGEVVTTFIYLGDDLNRHFISDGSSALVIYDENEILGSDFAVGDGMEGLRGQLLVDSETRYLVPWDNPGVSSTGNDLPAMDLQLVDFNTDEHQSWLVDIGAVEFLEEGVFEVSAHYHITDPSLTEVNGDAVRFTTHEFSDSLDYIGETIPTEKVNIRAVVTEDTGTPQLTALSLDDMPILAPSFDVEFVNLQWPISTELVSGESEMAYGRIFVPEVTDDDIEVEGLTAWLGIHNENTDPAGWNESVWTQMEFNAAGSDAAYDEYMAELNMMVPGEYYYATRFIAGEADTLYGGTSDDEGQFGRGGFWNGEDFVSGELTVTGVEAENIAELLEVAEVGSGINYTITDEVYLVFNSDFRNRKVVVDPSGGIVLDDFNGILSTEFNRYDGLTGLTGSVSEFNGLIQFVPQLPIEEASSSDNRIYPNRVSSLAEINSTRQGELVYIEDVSFSESGQFANQTNYTLVDAEGNELVMRTDRIEESILYDGEETYIGTQIPQGPVNLVGYVGMFNDPQLTVRKLGDIIDPDAIAAFDLLSPADAGDELESVVVQGGENEVVSITWQSAESDLDINYRWIAQLPGLYHTPPALDLQSDEEGAQASLTFTIRELDQVLEASGIAVDNELVVNWTIVAEDTGSEAFRYASEHRTVVLQRGTVTSSRGLADLPTEVGLKQNYPNPFNPVTTIRYQLPADMHVELRVYNLLGQEVAILVNEQVSAGTHEVSFDGSRLSSGVYIYRLQAGGKAITNRMTLVK